MAERTPEQARRELIMARSGPAGGSGRGKNGSNRTKHRAKPTGNQMRFVRKTGDR